MLGPYVQTYLLSIPAAVCTANGDNSISKFFLESFSVEVMLQNQGSMNICIILYNIIGLKSLDSQNYLNQSVRCPFTAWIISGQKCVEYRLSHTQVVHCSSLHICRLKFTPNRVINSEEYANSSVNYWICCFNKCSE